TGIADHIAFKNAIQRINLVPLPTDPSALNGHGTAVASVIFSNNPLAPGVAPSATPLSVRIADDNGTSNTFLIAQGIIAAVASSSGNPTMSPEQAASLVMSNLTDVGIAGTDPNTGGGVPDMGSFMNLWT
ncbi:MAG: S8 family serine peptidase, partial [bacterium]